MKKWLSIIMGLALLTCVVLGFSVYDYAYQAGYSTASLTNIVIIQDTQRKAWQLGYDQAIFDIGYECCDICVRYPTEAEVLTFLEEDNTDSIPYVKQDFICTDYADQLIERAWQQNLPAWLVLISFEDNYMGHAIVVFDIRVDTDKSCSVKQLFIDPQSDAEFQDITIGEIFILCDGGVCKTNTIGKIRIYK